MAKLDKLDKRTRVGAVTDAVESIESGIKSFEKAIADLPARVQKSYQPLISAQVEVNKLIKEEQDKEKELSSDLNTDENRRKTNKGDVKLPPPPEQRRVERDIKAYEGKVRPLPEVILN